MNYFAASNETFFSTPQPPFCVPLSYSCFISFYIYLYICFSLHPLYVLTFSMRRVLRSSSRCVTYIEDVGALSSRIRICVFWLAHRMGRGRCSRFHLASYLRVSHFQFISTSLLTLKPFLPAAA